MPAARPRVHLVLYISAASQYAQTAIRNCEQLLRQFNDRDIRLEICDVSRHPDRADADCVTYTPMLVKQSPTPRTYILGDLSNTTALTGLLESCGLEPNRR